MELKKCVVVTKNGGSTIYEISVEKELMQELIFEVTINGKEFVDTIHPEIVTRAFAEKTKNEVIFQECGLRYARFEEVTEGLNRGLFKCYPRFCEYNSLSLQLLAFMESPSRLKSLFPNKDNAFYEKILALISKREVETIATEGLVKKVRSSFPDENWIKRSVLASKFLQESQILNEEDIAEFEKIRDVNDVDKKPKGKVRRKFLAVHELGIG